MAGEKKPIRIRYHTPNTTNIRYYDPETDTPKPTEKETSISVDVCTISANGAHGIAYYDFEDCKFIFLTQGHSTAWRWYYPLAKVEDAFSK